jgi:uncharacterized protein HemY
MTRATSRISRRIAIAGAALALLAIGLVAARTWAAANEDYTNRLSLGRDVVKLAVVAMANQTPIAAGDAQAVLPMLEQVRAQEAMTEERAAQLDGQLQKALSAPLREAVGKVRLPEPRPDAREFVLHRWSEHPRAGNPAKYGPASVAFDRLIAFFRDTAQQGK